MVGGGGGGDAIGGGGGLALAASSHCATLEHSIHCLLAVCVHPAGLHIRVGGVSRALPPSNAFS